jgi:glucose-6-phosphate dehydrogenase assembly protein OpcA
MPLIDTSALGVPVEVAQIPKELKKLWESTGGTTTRASLINFAVYFQGAAGIQPNSDLINEFTRHHACRAVLICHEPDAAEGKVSAFINAHCHLTRAGAKQICCEQISLLFEGKTAGRIPNTLFANLDSDLPLYLWWQGEFPNPIDESLWSRVDRLIYDSQAWANPKQQFQRLLSSLDRAQANVVLCDLNWARSLHLRQALAQMFDHEENLPILNALKTVTIAHAPENRSTALLLTSWLAAQLQLSEPKRDGENLSFSHPAGHRVTFGFRSEPGRSISVCDLSDGASTVHIYRDAQGDFFRVEVRLSSGVTYNHLLPAGNNSTTSLLLWEIGGGSRHKVYHRAVEIIDSLLSL